MKSKILFLLLLFSVSGYLQSQNTMQTAVDIGSKSASFTYSNTQSTNNSGNNYGRSTNDVYHKFTLTTGMEIIISHCGSALGDTYVYLLNSSGGLIDSNDDSDGVVCSVRLHSYLKKTLAAGTYYIVSEGYSSNGSITLSVNGTVQVSNGYSQDQNYVSTTTYLTETKTDSLETIQYFDGLGRPVQVVQKNITSNGNDLVTYQEYDGFGRDSSLWLPAIASGNNGAFIPLSDFKTKSTATYNNTTYNSAADTKPCSRPVYEASPLNRVLEQYGPGADWHNNNKVVKTAYQTNTSSFVVPYYTTTDVKTAVSITRSGNYPNNQLFVTEIMDEDGNKSYEAKDKLGQLVYTKQMDGNTPIETCYVYDSYGNLRAVLPPLAVFASGTWTETTADFKNYAYAYKYDGRNRCISKKIPGAEWIDYVYDMADRLILTQDGEQRAKNSGQWSINKYDLLGRVIYTGLVSSVSNQDKENVKNLVITETFVGNQSGNILGYSCGYFVDRVTGLTANYYDNYSFLGISQIPNNTNTQYDNEGYAACYGDHQTANAHKSKGLLTGTMTAQMNSDGTLSSTYLYSVMYYDERGRIVQTKSNNHLSGGIEKEYIAYNFTGQPTKKKHVHKATGKDEQTEVYDYTYDYAGRHRTTTHKLNSNAAVLLTYNTYDELGRLKTNTKGGHANLVTEYKYNIRSYLKSITSPLFAQTLYYNEQYGGSVKRYNGNISAMSWKVSDESQTRGYAFTYDNLSRLTAAGYLENGSSNNNYKTSYSYDKHGNILSLQRYGKTTATAYGLIDNLTMSFNGNQLSRVEDAAANIIIAESMDFKNYSNTANEYTYNANGAMNKDLNRGISEIQYNLLNLPRQMLINTSTAKGKNYYTYSASGAKLRTEQRYDPNLLVTPVNTTTPANDGLSDYKNTDYVGNIIYETTKVGSTIANNTRILIEGGYIENGTYHFYQTDHLGNNRLAVTGRGVVVQKNHYYPFGMPFAETPFTEQGKQPYKFGNKELDMMHGVNWYDFEARYYFSDIPRTPTLDPMAEKYYSISPYAWCANNPINAVDLRGDSITYIHNNIGYEYNNGAFWTAQGMKYTPETGTTMEKVLNAYNKILDSGDKELIKQLRTLEKSEKMHIIREGSTGSSSVRVTENRSHTEDDKMISEGKPVKTRTVFDFSDYRKENWEKSNGVKFSEFGTVVHEMQHQYDYDQGNMKDRLLPSSAKSPQEIRAVRSENKARNMEHLPLRTKYGGVAIKF